jgi:hypothetical protein
MVSTTEQAGEFGLGRPGGVVTAPRRNQPVSPVHASGRPQTEKADKSESFKPGGIGKLLLRNQTASQQLKPKPHGLLALLEKSSFDKHN